MNARRICLLTGLFLVALPAAGGVIGGYEPKVVTEVFSYTDYGGGDVIFRVNAPIRGCEGGFWLRPTDPGFKQSLATVLLAYGSKSTVRVWAYDDEPWPGSPAPTCRMYVISPA
jgi:hypothetical protein